MKNINNKEHINKYKDKLMLYVLNNNINKNNKTINKQKNKQKYK